MYEAICDPVAGINAKDLILCIVVALGYLIVPYYLCKHAEELLVIHYRLTKWIHDRVFKWLIKREVKSMTKEEYVEEHSDLLI